MDNEDNEDNEDNDAVLMQCFLFHVGGGIRRTGGERRHSQPACESVRGG